MFFFMLDLFDRQFTHPIIMCTLFLALMLRDSYGFFGGFHRLFLFFREQCKLLTVVHDDRALFCFASEDLLF